MLYLVRYPEVQEVAREEVERVVGEERPGLHHALPYCQAVIQEVQRLSCVAPQTIPHRCPVSSSLSRVMKDVTAEGFSIPSGSFALANLTGFMQDPDYWEEAAAFRSPTTQALFNLTQFSILKTQRM